VLAGHTSSDQVETILYRLAASPGRRALLGMPARRGLLLRPLLAVTREQTGAYCAARGLRFGDDPTNDTDAYARGRVRNIVLPALRELHPAADANVLATAQTLRDEAEVLDEAVRGVLGGRGRVELATLAGLPPALARLVVARLAEDAAGGPAGAVGARLAELLSLGSGGGSAELHLGGGLRAVVEYGVLRFAAPGASPAGAPPLASVELEQGASARFGSWELYCGAPADGAPPGEGRVEGDSRLSVLLDADAVAGGLTVRAWRDGDRIAPLGLAGSKTLADVFVDARVPREQRRSVPVLASGSQIVWVAGLAVSRRFAAGEHSRRAVRVHARHMGPRGDPADSPAPVNMLDGSPPGVSRPVQRQPPPSPPPDLSR
jgi:tRNA(Ile)-lysidine synthase